MAQSLLEALQSGRVLLMDGAMGTELQRLGLKAPHRPEDWNLDQPEAGRVVHRGYVQAGAEVLLTNTFQANPVALADRQKFQPQFMAESVRSAIDIASEFAGHGRYLLFDVGPIIGRDG